MDADPETGGDQIRVGAGIAGYDVLGYHAYAASATWLVSHPEDAATPSSATPDWQAYYLYDRWRPTFDVWRAAIRHSSPARRPSAAPRRR